jgi:hypothetical protein
MVCNYRSTVRRSNLSARLESAVGSFSSMPCGDRGAGLRRNSAEMHIRRRRQRRAASRRVASSRRSNMRFSFRGAMVYDERQRRR